MASSRCWVNQKSSWLSDAYTAKDPLTSLTAQVVSAYVGKHVLPAGDLPHLITQVHHALSGLGERSNVPVEPEKPVPAVPIRKSLQDEYLICLEDGQKFKSLKRHLMTHYGMTVDEYRTKWELPASYPMVAPSYAARRSELAKSIGLGQRRKTEAAAPVQPETAAEALPASEKSKKQAPAAGRKPRTKAKPAVGT